MAHAVPFELRAFVAEAWDLGGTGSEPGCQCKSSGRGIMSTASQTADFLGLFFVQSLSQSFPNPNHWHFQPRPDLLGLSTGAGLAGEAQPQSRLNIIYMEGTEPLHKHV